MEISVPYLEEAQGPVKILQCHQEKHQSETKVYNHIKDMNEHLKQK